jgi:hypothetical protein
MLGNAGQWPTGGVGSTQQNCVYICLWPGAPLLEDARNTGKTHAWELFTKALFVIVKPGRTSDGHPRRATEPATCGMPCTSDWEYVTPSRGRWMKVP